LSSQAFVGSLRNGPENVSEWMASPDTRIQSASVNDTSRERSTDSLNAAARRA
jgi:hypothetical protein